MADKAATIERPARTKASKRGGSSHHGGGTQAKSAPSKTKRSTRKRKASPTSEEERASAHNIELGRRGEEAAARFLDRRGYEIIARNWRCLAGEADIIACDDETLVFVEVKTRSSCDKGLPSEAVTPDKRTRYENIAALFLQDYDVVDMAVRFDIIAILVMEPDRAFIRHHINAFSAG